MINSGLGSHQPSILLYTQPKIHLQGIDLCRVKKVYDEELYSLIVQDSVLQCIS